MTRLAASAAAVVGAAIATVVLLGEAPARADAIGAPPEDCPAGSVGQSSHSGEWCAATSCASDTDCANYGWSSDPPRHYVCRQTELCVRDETYTPSQRLAPVPGRPPPTATRTIGVGACGSECVAPATCTNTKRCVEESAVAGAGRALGLGAARSSGSGCGSCTVGQREHAGTSGSAIGAAFLAIALGLRRTCRRR